MRNIKFNHFKSFKKKSGTLIPFSLKKDIPFDVKRIFIVYGNKNFTRAKHAHKKCSQFILPIHGKIELYCENKSIKFKKKLDYKKKEAYLMKPLTWCRIKFLTNYSILMVFCDKEYDYKDYIEKYKDFLKIIKIKWK